MGKRAGQPAAHLEPEVLRRFEELTLPHLKDLYGLAVRLTGDRPTSEDLVQETYLKALQAFPTLRNPDKVRPWLFQILSRLVTDRQRTDGREVLTADPRELDRFSLYDLVAQEDPFPYSDRLHEDFLGQFPDEEVRGALLALPEEYRVPLVLVYAEGMSYRELATSLGCPLGTVMSRLHRGRKILERALWECAKRKGLVRTWKA
ncbi:MAG: sigma-70 family RNA polymerase sigma factor [candidate division NC10 bacterium]|nr:sigma-70 family RNA polymerase sigma factor [candidate division NC10 bacterium]